MSLKMRTEAAMTPLATAVAAVWQRKAGDLLDADRRKTFEAQLMGIVRAAWRRRCHAAGVRCVGDKAAPAAALTLDRLVTPKYGLDVDPVAGGPDPAETFGRQVEAALAGLLGRAQERPGTAVGDVAFWGDRRAYMFEHFFYVLVYQDK